MTPLLWVISGVSRLANYLVGGKESAENFYISQEELQKLLEEQDDIQKPSGPESEDFDTITANIFKLNQKEARQIMEPIAHVPMIGANATVIEARRLMSKTKERFLPIYLKDTHNVIGIAFPRDLIRVPDNKRLRDYCRPPWFITQNTNVLQILKQFKSNNQSVAIILDDKGQTTGILSLDIIMEAIFGKTYYNKEKRTSTSPQLVIDRTLAGKMTVKEFDEQFNVKLSENIQLTLGELVVETLGHMPEEGESVNIGTFEITVKEATLLEIKSVTVITRHV